MDLATLLGVLGAFGVVAGAMTMSGGIGIYVDVASILIVFAGTIFVVLVKFNVRQFLGCFKVAGKAFMFKLVAPLDLIEEVVALADIARKNGLLALEDKEVSDDFLIACKTSTSLSMKITFNMIAM